MDNDEDFERDMEDIVRLITFIDERVRSKKLVLSPIQEVQLSRAKAVVNRLQDELNNTNLIGVIHLN
jgi:hypothetical protein